MKEIIVSSNAPAAIGPYSHAVAMEGIVFTSGQLGIDPATGKMAEGVEAQAAGASMRDVVKTTVFVQDLGDFAVVNRVYGERFGAEFPARSCVQVAALPANALVEVEAIAFRSADETYGY